MRWWRKRFWWTRRLASRIAEYQSRPISVAGAVKVPLTFQAVGKTTLLEALTRAQGLSEDAGPEILLTRPGETVERIPIKKLIDAADPLWNVTLTGGEEVRVPAAGHVFVAGNVKHPGAFRVDSGGETTVLKAVALAEGLAPFSTKGAYIFRAGGEWRAHGNRGRAEQDHGSQGAGRGARGQRHPLYTGQPLAAHDDECDRKGDWICYRDGVGGFDFGAALIMMNRNEPEILPAVVEMGRAATPFYLAPPYQATEEESEEAKIPLSQYFWILKRHRWRIGGFVAAMMLGTLVVSARLTPIYESTATVDIDRQSPSGVVGEDATRSALNDSDQFMATQIKLVESDSVLRPVDQRFELRKLEGQTCGAVGAGGGGSGDAEAVEGYAAAQYLFDADRVPVSRSATGGGCGECDYAVLSGAQLRDPAAQFGGRG